MFERIIQTPLGEIRLRSDGKSLTGLWFVGQVNDAKEHSDTEIKDDLPIFGQVETWLESYFLESKLRLHFRCSRKEPFFKKEFGRFCKKFRMEKR